MIEANKTETRRVESVLNSGFGTAKQHSIGGVNIRISPSSRKRYLRFWYVAAGLLFVNQQRFGLGIKNSMRQARISGIVDREQLLMIASEQI